MVFKLLKPFDLARLSAVNKHLRSVISSADHLWFKHCWELIGLNWPFFDDLPVKKQDESYMKYFPALAQLIRMRYSYKNEFLERRELNFDGEIWTPVRDFQFEANVWRAINASPDATIGQRGSLWEHNYLIDVICYKRNKVCYPEIHELKKLPDGVIKEFFVLAHGLDVSHDYFEDFTKFFHRSPLTKFLHRSPLSSLLVEEKFRQQFKNIPPHCMKFKLDIDIPGDHLFHPGGMTICLLITEFLSDPLRKLVLLNEIELQSVFSIIQEPVVMFAIQCLPKEDQKYIKKFGTINWELVFDHADLHLFRQPAGDVIRRILALARNNLNTVLENRGLHSWNIPGETAEEFVKLLLKTYFEQYFDNDDDDDDDDDEHFPTNFKRTNLDENCYFMFVRNYMKLYLQKNSEPVYKYIKNFLFETDSTVRNSESKNIASWILTDSEFLGGNSQDESDASRMFVSDTRAVFIREHVPNCNFYVG
ncbi:Uncharacterised protein g11271 [Pycnogonum litorale]